MTEQQLIEKGQQFLDSDLHGPPAFNKWRSSVLSWLETHHPESDSLQSIRLIPRADRAKNTHSGRGLRAGDRQNVVRIMKLLATVEDGSTTSSPTKRKAVNRRVFVVHGRHNELKVSVARFLERLDLEPIILHEQADCGRTIIDKFVQSADVAFAVVLLTADDRGGLATTPAEKYKPRARQNVILELGYFMGRLRPDQIVAIYQSGVEIPSDYQGKLFVPFDDEGAWKFHLAREIRASGIEIDMNRI
ncbi:MAG: nucleotide-binding protein [Verrucomicrobia bacterium]|nr:nucleotide-binding protein [Verrucomicrobiota bacterium]